jgi:hypothetical protein
MTKNPLLRGLPPVHPGELLREDVLPALGRPKAEIARLRSAPTISTSPKRNWPARSREFLR